MKPRFFSRAGFTLSEVIIGAAIMSIVFAGLVIGVVTLQRTFAAVDGFGNAQSYQLYALDYIVRDVRRAQSVAVTASPTALTVTAQVYIDPQSNEPRNATISGGAVTYGDTNTVTYKLSGSDLVREEGGNRLVIASGVTSFAPEMDAGDSKQKTVNVTLSFASPLKWRFAFGAPTTVTMRAKATARN